MADENGDKRPAKRRNVQGMLDETDPLTVSYLCNFLLFNLKVYKDEIPETLTTKHYTTLQGWYQEEQKYHDYPLAFNIEHIRTKIRQLIYDTKCYLANTKQDFTNKRKGKREGFLPKVYEIFGKWNASRRKIFKERGESTYRFSLPTYSKPFEAWIYSSVAVRIFAFEWNDNCSWP